MGKYLLLGGIRETNLSHQPVYLRHEGIVGVIDFGKAGIQKGVLLGKLRDFPFQGFVALVERFNLVLELFLVHLVNLRDFAELRGNTSTNHILAASKGARDRKHGLRVGAIERTDRHCCFAFVVAYGSGYRNLVIVLKFKRVQICHGSGASTDLIDIVLESFSGMPELTTAHGIEAVRGDFAVCDVADFMVIGVDTVFVDVTFIADIEGASINIAVYLGIALGVAIAVDSLVSMSYGVAVCFEVSFDMYVLIEGRIGFELGGGIHGQLVRGIIAQRRVALDIQVFIDGLAAMHRGITVSFRVALHMEIFVNSLGAMNCHILIEFGVILDVECTINSLIPVYSQVLVNSFVAFDVAVTVYGLVSMNMRIPANVQRTIYPLIAMYGEVFVDFRIAVQVCFTVDFQIALAMDISACGDTTCCGDSAVNMNIFCFHGFVDDDGATRGINARVLDFVLGKVSNDLLARLVDIIHGDIGFAFGNLVCVCFGVRFRSVGYNIRI